MLKKNKKNKHIRYFQLKNDQDLAVKSSRTFENKKEDRITEFENKYKRLLLMVGSHSENVV